MNYELYKNPQNGVEFTHKCYCGEVGSTRIEEFIEKSEESDFPMLFVNDYKHWIVAISNSLFHEGRGGNGKEFGFVFTDMVNTPTLEDVYMAALKAAFIVS